MNHPSCLSAGAGKSLIPGCRVPCPPRSGAQTPHRRLPASCGAWRGGGGPDRAAGWGGGARPPQRSHGGAPPSSPVTSSPLLSPSSHSHGAFRWGDGAESGSGKKPRVLLSTYCGRRFWGPRPPLTESRLGPGARGAEGAEPAAARRPAGPSVSLPRSCDAPRPEDAGKARLCGGFRPARRGPGPGSRRLCAAGRRGAPCRDRVRRDPGPRPAAGSAGAAREAGGSPGSAPAAAPRTHFVPDAPPSAPRAGPAAGARAEPPPGAPRNFLSEEGRRRGMRGRARRRRRGPGPGAHTHR